MHTDIHTQRETAAERTERHLRQLRNMADLGELLAERAAARAEMAFAQLPPGPEQKGDASARPQRGPHPATLFAQLAGVVRQSIRLECRVVAGHAASMPRHTQADPRRAKIRRAIRQATTGRPDRAIRRQEADALLETELALDPDGTASLPDLLDTICEDVGFNLDYQQPSADLAAPEAPSQHPTPSRNGWPNPTPPTPHPFEIDRHEETRILLL